GTLLLGAGEDQLQVGAGAARLPEGGQGVQHVRHRPGQTVLAALVLGASLRLGLLRHGRDRRPVLRGGRCVPAPGRLGVPGGRALLRAVADGPRQHGTQPAGAGPVGGAVPRRHHLAPGGHVLVQLGEPGRRRRAAAWRWRAGSAGWASTAARREAAGVPVITVGAIRCRSYRYCNAPSSKLDRAPPPEITRPVVWLPGSFGTCPPSARMRRWRRPVTGPGADMGQA